MSTDAALAQLPSEAAAAVRAELAPGEQVVYAGVPRSEFDSGQLACTLRGPLLLWPGLAASLFALVIGAALLVTGARGVLQGTIDVFMATVLIVGLGGLLVQARHARRKAASSAWVVTGRRALGITTWPERSVISIAPDDIEEVYCWIVSPNCGNVRFKSDIRSTAANALMYVPEPRTCEAAMRALVPAHSNSDP